MRGEEKVEALIKSLGLPKKVENYVYKPKHYAQRGYTPMLLMEDVFSKELLLGYFLGTAIKYLNRFMYKENILQDLGKALFHLAYISETFKEDEEVYQIGVHNKGKIAECVSEYTGKNVSDVAETEKYLSSLNEIYTSIQILLETEVLTGSEISLTAQAMCYELTRLIKQVVKEDE